MLLFSDIYRGKKVFITGHTGFKGSWLLKWLELLGAEVKGYALPPSTNPNHLELLNSSSESIFADITDRAKLEFELTQFDPDIVFHLAAQPLVRYSYGHPFETFDTNVMGTLNVLEACRKAENVKAIVCITTDKVYENHESKTGYVETDRLGGYDPYSASKACAELVISSYTNSYFPLNEYSHTHRTLIASARGGNVIGGGDWSLDRLIPDIVQSIHTEKPLEIRSPKSVRPWQHVLDCLSGYLLLGQQLLEGKKEVAGPWNFGPLETKGITVAEIIEIALKEWKHFDVHLNDSDLHETTFLTLNCKKAVSELHWKPLLDDATMFKWTFNWYDSFYKNEVLTEVQLSNYFEKAKHEQVIWIK